MGASFWVYKKGNWRIGGEVKTYYVSKLDDWDLLLQLRIKYQLFTF